jgi:repressor LexA
MRTAEEIIAYIKTLRLKRKMSLETLASKVGVAKSTLSRYENGSRDFPINDIHLYAEALGKSTFNLLGLPEEQSNYDSKQIPFYGDVAAGALSVIDPTLSQDVEYIELPHHLLGKYANSTGLFAMRVNGESMNKIIPNDSIVIAKEYDNADYKENDIVIFKHDHEYSLKRFKPADIEGGYLFKSESTNECFKDIFITFNTNADFKICAKVITYTVFVN